MGATTFDPLRIARDLHAAGIERDHAEALAEAMREAATADHAALATKADINAMIAAQDARFYRAMWLQAGAIVAAHVAIAAALVGLLI